MNFKDIIDFKDIIGIFEKLPREKDKSLLKEFINLYFEYLAGKKTNNEIGESLFEMEEKIASMLNEDKKLFMTGQSDIDVLGIVTKYCKAEYNKKLKEYAAKDEEEENFFNENEHIIKDLLALIEPEPEENENQCIVDNKQLDLYSEFFCDLKKAEQNLDFELFKCLSEELEEFKADSLNDYWKEENRKIVEEIFGLLEESAELKSFFSEDEIDEYISIDDINYYKEEISKVKWEENPLFHLEIAKKNALIRQLQKKNAKSVEELKNERSTNLEMLENLKVLNEKKYQTNLDMALAEKDREIEEKNREIIKLKRFLINNNLIEQFNKLELEAKVENN